MTSKLRLGVDVGGTFTKAIAIQTQPYALIAQAITPTTHNAAEGVAHGLVQVLRELLAHPAVQAGSVSLVAHSTTQAVNALLEGDTACVGIVGMGRGHDIRDAIRRTRVGNIPLAPGRFLQTHHLFVDTTAGLTPEAAAQAVETLKTLGAQAIVASEAFSVDDPTHELTVIEAAAQQGLPSVAGHQLSGVYGLEIRTLTAAINASLLPKMLQTAELVERSLSIAGVHAPLMVMRGDGGLTDLATLRLRPILTLLSGPAASLAGALLSGSVVDGVFLEVGGTSSNLGVIRGGQPQMRYVQVMDHPTCIRSLDVQVQGVAGGSMVRIRGRKITDVGPRSAHIAGLPYASLSAESLQGELTLELIAPKPGDAADHAMVRTSDGQQFALTVTCAANALGEIPEAAYAHGSREAALRAFAVLGRALNCSAEEAAQRTLDLAARPIAKAIERLAGEYKLRHHAFQLIGGGGGAGALVPAVARRLGLPYRLAQQAEVISSLGDAMAGVREELERAVGDTTSAQALMEEARAAAIQAGADPGSLDVTIERDDERGTLRAVATGNVALAAPISQAEISEAEAQTLAVQTAGIPSKSLSLLADTGDFWVYQSKTNLFRRSQILVVDRYGRVQLTLTGGRLVSGTAEVVLTGLQKQLPSAPDLLRFPKIHLLMGARLLELTPSANLNGILASAEAAMARAGASATIIAIIE